MMPDYEIDDIFSDSEEEEFELKECKDFKK